MSISIDDLKKAFKEALEEHFGRSESVVSESHVDHVLNCPDCWNELQNKLTYECSECGLPMTKERAKLLDKCPNCGSTEARKSVDIEEKGR